MIVMTMAITASVNASSRPFVTARASHTKLPLTEDRYDQDDLSSGPGQRSVVFNNYVGRLQVHSLSGTYPEHNGSLVTAREASGR